MTEQEQNGDSLIEERFLTLREPAEVLRLSSRTAAGRKEFDPVILFPGGKSYWPGGDHAGKLRLQHCDRCARTALNPKS